MIKAVFFDWFSTLAHYDPPREQLQAQVLRELGLNIALPVMQRALVLADKDFYGELAEKPMRNRTPEERSQVLIHHQQSALTHAGVNSSNYDVNHENLVAGGNSHVDYEHHPHLFGAQCL